MSELASPRVPQQARSRAKYEALLQAAAKLFRERGYLETTIDAVVEASGVSVGVFYSYFSSKRQLLLALLEKDIHSENTNVFALPHQKMTLPEIEAILRQSLRQHGGLRRARQELALVDADFAQRDYQFQQRVQEKLATNLERLRLVGRIRADITSTTCSWMLCTIFSHLFDTTMEQHEKEMEPEVQAAALLIYHMLVPDDIDPHTEE
jgi:TetR/AcrR family transcriptional repressor of mexJK operon